MDSDDDTTDGILFEIKDAIERTNQAARDRIAAYDARQREFAERDRMVRDRACEELFRILEDGSEDTEHRLAAGGLILQNGW